MPTLDTYRKQAKLMLRWHRDGDYGIGEKLRRLERHRTTTDLTRPSAEQPRKPAPRP
jgi:hypothetical protein